MMKIKEFLGNHFFKEYKKKMCINNSDHKIMMNH